MVTTLRVKRRSGTRSTYGRSMSYHTGLAGVLGDAASQPAQSVVSEHFMQIEWDGSDKGILRS